jgi:hypothetical protein
MSTAVSKIALRALLISASVYGPIMSFIYPIERMLK